MTERPVTSVIEATWRHYVASHLTQAGLLDWVESLPVEHYLRLHGLFVARRDLRINTRELGLWQVTEHYTPGTTSEDASDGPWAIVGDDRGALIAESLGRIRDAWTSRPNTKEEK